MKNPEFMKQDTQDALQFDQQNDNMAMNVSIHSADINDSADIGDDNKSEASEQKDLFGVGKKRGNTQVTVKISNSFNRNVQDSKKYGHMAVQRQKTRIASKQDPEQDNNKDNTLESLPEEDIQDSQESYYQEDNVKKFDPEEAGQEAMFAQQQAILAQNTSIASIVERLTLNHSLSKIGQKPFLDENDTKVQVLYHDSQFYDFDIQEGVNLKSKKRRHHRKSFKSTKMTMQKLKQEYLDHLKMQGQLSVSQLQKHIHATHPKRVNDKTSEYKNWSICENIGSLINLNCCTERKIYDVSKNLGLGPSLYLISLKAYIKLFFVLSLMCIPSIVVLMSGDQIEDMGLNDGSLFELLSRTTLGNFGYLGKSTCNSMNLASVPGSIYMHCPSGVFDSITAVGLNSELDQDVCHDFKEARTQVVKKDGTVLKDQADISSNLISGDATRYNRYVNLQASCNSYLNTDFQKSEYVQYLETKFNENCKGKEKCSIQEIPSPLKLMSGAEFKLLDADCQLEMLKRSAFSKNDSLALSYDAAGKSIFPFVPKDYTYQYKPEVQEPMFYILSRCKEDYFQVKMTSIKMTTDQLGQFLVMSDIIILLVLILGYNMIYYMQKDFANQYDQNTIEAKDFTLMINKLPKSFSQYKDELSIKFAIWKQIQEKIEKCKKQGLCPQDLDTSIVEINFGIGDISFLDKQKEIGALIEEIETNHILIEEANKSTNRFSKNDLLTKAKTNALKNAQVLQREVDVFKIQYALKLGIENDATQEEIKGIDELSVKKQALDLHEQIKLVYITFSSMQTKHLVERIFYQKKYFNILRVSEYFQRKKQLKIIEEATTDKPKGDEEKSGSIYLVENPSPQKVYYIDDFRDKKDGEFKCADVNYEPDNINWSNMNMDWCPFISRKVQSLIIMGSIVGFTILFIMLFHNKFVMASQARNSPFMDDDYSCTDYTNVQFDQALGNSKLEAPKRSQELMTCFCRQQFMNNLQGFFSLRFEGAQASADGREIYSGLQPCLDWLSVRVYRKLSDYMPAVIVVLMNSISIPILFFASKHERHRTQDQETSILHHLIVTVWFVNTIMVLIFYTQSLRAGESFTLSWYTSVCSTLGLAIFQLLAPFLIVGLSFYMFVMCKRYRDRDNNKSLFKVTDRKKLNDSNSDLVNTQLSTQKQLYKLYTGPQFRGGMVQSQITTIVFICLFFSGTMPLLYPIALTYLVVIYWFSKFMLLKFCQKTTIFNEELVLNSYKTIKFAILFHLVMTLMMLSNSDMLGAAESQGVNFSTTSTQASSASLTDQESRPAFIGAYISFLISILFLYAINVFFINPLSIFNIVGNCIKARIDSKKMSTEIKQERIKQYIENSETKDGEATTKKIDTVTSVPKGGKSQSVNSSPSRQSVIQYNKHKKDDSFMDMRGSKVSSNNYYGEVSFDTLRFHYSNIIEAIIKSNRRLNLYWRVSRVNSNSQMCEIFSEKYHAHMTYHDMLISNKLNIEKQIHFYWNYIKENVDKEVKTVDDRRNTIVKGSIVHKNSNLLKSNSMTYEAGYFSNNEHYQIKINKIHGIPDDQSKPDDAEQDPDNVEQITKKVNAFQRKNTAQIKYQEDLEEFELRQSCMLFFKMLDYLDMNFEEDWLKQNYLPERLRCMSQIQSYNIFDSKEYYDAYSNNWLSRAEMILKNPLMFDNNQTKDGPEEAPATTLAKEANKKKDNFDSIQAQAVDDIQFENMQHVPHIKIQSDDQMSIMSPNFNPIGESINNGNLNLSVSIVDNSNQQLVDNSNQQLVQHEIDPTAEVSKFLGGSNKSNDKEGFSSKGKSSKAHNSGPLQDQTQLNSKDKL